MTPECELSPRAVDAAIILLLLILLILLSVYIHNLSATRCPVIQQSKDQMTERLIRNKKVRGSTPLGSTILQRQDSQCKVPDQGLTPPSPSPLHFRNRVQSQATLGPTTK